MILEFQSAVISSPSDSRYRACKTPHTILHQFVFKRFAHDLSTFMLFGYFL